jgi:hypothetical protein
MSEVRRSDENSIECILWESNSAVLDKSELIVPQQELPQKVSEVFNSTSTLLGGLGEEGRGKINFASRAKTVQAALDFASASQRFHN